MNSTFSIDYFKLRYYVKTYIYFGRHIAALLGLQACLPIIIPEGPDYEKTYAAD
jgi:hypothetical protein